METELERRARIQANLRKMVDGGATHAEIQQYVDSERITPEMEAARTPLSGVEKMAGGTQAALQGLTLSFGDELAGGLEGMLDPNKSIGEAVGEQRASLGAFRRENPKTALGLELGGAVLPALATAGLAGGAPTAGRVAAVGAGTGAVAGYGSGEGGVLSGDRVTRGVTGGALGGLLGALAPKVLTTQGGLAGPGGQVTDDLLSRLAPAAGPAAPATRGFWERNFANEDLSGRYTGSQIPSQPPTAVQSSGLPTSPQGFGDPAFRAAGRAIPDRAKARTLLDELEAAGMGDEALAMNVGDDQTVRAVRAAANQPGSTAGQTVNSRLATQGGRLGEAVPRDIGEVTGMGGVPGPIRLDQMEKELAAKVGAGYDAFRARADVPLDPNDPAVQQFIKRYVDPVIENRRLTGTLSGESALSGRNVDAAFKNLQREVRGGNTAVALGNKNVDEVASREAIRDRVLAAIGETDPTYADLGRTYALDEDVGKVVQEAFDTGMSLPGKPVGTTTVELGKTTDAGKQAMRAGFATNLQQRAGARASNADLGDLAQFRDVARAVVGTPQDRERFIEAFGREKYDAMLQRLMPKIRAAAQNAAARGNSTTTKQLLDALAFGDDAMMDALGQLATGSPQGALRSVASKAFSPMDRAYRLGVGKTAGETADLLTTKGTPQIRTLLDYLDAMATEQGAARVGSVPGAQVATRGVTARRERPR